ncbi:MAG: hypothetical protein ACREAB_17685, partial [Blastocatellia bacterium]
MTNSRSFKKARFGSGLVLVAVLSWMALPDRFGVWMAPSPLDASALAGPRDLTATRPAPDQAIRARASEAYGRLPLSFEVNEGQTESRVKFLSRGPGYNLFLTPTEAVLELRIADREVRSDGFGDGYSSLFNPQSAIRNPQSTTLRMKLTGANPDPQVVGLD